MSARAFTGKQVSHATYRWHVSSQASLTAPARAIKGEAKPRYQFAPQKKNTTKKGGGRAVQKSRLRRRRRQQAANPPKTAAKRRRRGVAAAGGEEEEERVGEEDELAPATAADPSSLTESGDDPPGQGPGFTSSPLTGESFSAKSSSALVAVPPGRPPFSGAKNTSRRTSKSSIRGILGGIFSGGSRSGSGGGGGGDDA
ncbi:hypothetical protein FOIG_08601 [Fusarium odoratissimum NRRL 54006]|uniref:Uncharacterized protein n=2 Tax=Fusarium oxysporum species complex TaxID=171631 RepID=X0JEB2_FUSO5|nr:uncharacterized protein FOIG_08601 [Fusarium odoratissimum NRRL 54006]EXL99563.1 hypothetical protein FOIG_08601 [Fusarium odoratissimum NRRL 54006]TXC02149.1 hypothetical protein FocTR4_00015542 [Fusarium oxysporum f. sp. cubense]